MSKTIQNKILSHSSVFMSLMLAIGLALSPAQALATGPTTGSGSAVSANAGPDQTITLPTNRVTLVGSSSGFTGFAPPGYTWTKLSGSGNIDSPSSSTTDISSLTQGTSVFRLTAFDGVDTAIDDVTINVQASLGGGGGTGGGATVNAGPDQTLSYPTDSTTLSGSSTGINGITLYYTWTLISGSATFSSPNQASTFVSRLSTGDNIFRLTVTNNTGTTASDEVIVTVLQAGPPLDIPPTAYAGADQIITSPASSVTLSGNGVAYGSNNIVGYAWTKISGSGVINSATGSNGATVTVTGLTVGTSVFRLTVKDSIGATGYDDLNVVVNAAGTGGCTGTNCGTGGGGTGGGGTGGTGGGSGGGSGGGTSMTCPFGVTGTPATCVKINIPVTGVKVTSTSDSKKLLQMFLNWNLGIKIVPLVIDGKWGAKTDAAIRVYQKYGGAGLKVDGKFGPMSAGQANLLLKNANLYK